MRTALTASRSLVAFALVLASCSGSTSDSLATSTSTSSAPSASTSTTSTSTTSTPGPAVESTIERITTGDCPNRPPGSSSGDFGDGGTFAVNVTGFDLEALEVSVDVVQWLIGSEANDAYEAETGDSSGVPNDYWVVNDNPLVRTLPIAVDATLRIVRLGEDASADVSTASLDELPAYLDSTFETTTWWLTVEEGTVTELCEQYVP